MTAIVGFIENGRVFMGGDSAGINPATGDLQLTRHPKVFINGPYLIGVSISGRISQVLQHAELLPVPVTMDPYKFMVLNFLPYIRNVVENAGVPTEENYQLLVGFNGRLFRTFGARLVSEVTTPYDATGCGAPVALGAMYVMGKYQPETKILMALSAAEAFCSGVRGPFTVLSI